MKKILLLLMLVATQAFATKYYMKNAGNNSANGTSDATAWQSPAKFSSFTFAGGDTICLLWGEEWHTGSIALSRGAGTDRVVITTYGPRGARPILTARDSIASWRTGWTLYSSGTGWSIWKRATATEYYRCWLNGQEFGDAYTIDRISARYRWYLCDNCGVDDGQLYMYVPNQTLSPGQYYSSCEFSNAWSYIFSISSNYWTFLNIEFQGGYNELYLSGCSYLLIDSCSIGAYAGGYGIHAFNSAVNDYGEVRNSTLSSVDTVFHQYGSPHHGGVSEAIRLEDNCNNWRIHHNIFGPWSHGAVGMISFSTGASTLNNNWVYENDFSGEGKIDYGRVGGVGWDAAGTARAGYVSFNRWFKNFIHNWPTQFQLGGDRNAFVYNIIDTMYEVWPSRLDDAKPECTTGIAIGGYTIAYYDTVAHNTIAHCAHVGIKIEQGSGTYGDVIANNILYGCGTYVHGTVREYLVGVQLWVKSVSNYHVYKNNNMYGSTAQPVVFNVGPPGSYTGVDHSETIETFNARNGTAHSGGTGTDIVTDNIRTAPQFASGTGKTRWKLSSASPKDNGVNLGYTSDIFGVTVPYNSIPDIGAAEWNGSSSPPAASPRWYILKK